MSIPKQLKMTVIPTTAIQHSSSNNQVAIDEEVPKALSQVVTEIFHQMNEDVLEDIPLTNGRVVSEMFVRILERLHKEENVNLDRMKNLVFEEFAREAQMVKDGTALHVYDWQAAQYQIDYDDPKYDAD
jgi:hypothetical protein